MSQPQVTAFLNDLNENNNLQEQLNDMLDTGGSDQPKEQILKRIVGFAADQGYEITAEEYKSVLKKKQKELSDDELENVAGGGSVYQTESTSWLHCI